MFQMRKIRSYTIMEMIVVMIISAIVVGTAYNTYRIVFQQYLTMRNTSEILRQMSLLDVLISRDVDNCNYIRRTHEGFSCHYEINEINYYLEKDLVLRAEGLVMDTFRISPLNIDMKYNNVDVMQVSSYVDRITFEHRYKDETISFAFQKKYGADFLMKADSHLATEE
jgi:hypothetical protein